MDNLTRVIGPAPSEMSLEELEEAIRREHSRVARGLEAGAYSYGAKNKKLKAPSQTAKAKTMEEKYNMPLEEMERKLELLKKFEENQEKIKHGDRKLAHQQDENAQRAEGENGES